MVTEVGQALPADVIPELLGSGKPLMELRCYADGELIAIVLKIYQTLLSLKNMSMLETVYK